MGDDEDGPGGGNAADELRADCLRLLAHDLNNPLTAIRILAEMLREEMPDTAMRQDVSDILEASDLAGALMDGLSSLVCTDGREEEYTWFSIDLVEVLRQAVDRPALRHHVRLELPRELQMGGDRMALRRCFTDVLVNARRLVDVGVPVPVSAWEDGSVVAVRVKHPGHGIPEELRPLLFERYGAVVLRQSMIPVAAAGLFHARSVIEGHGGTLTLSDAPEGGMDLTIRLPR